MSRALHVLRAWLVGCPVCAMPGLLAARGRERRHLVFCRYGRLPGRPR